MNLHLGGMKKTILFGLTLISLRIDAQTIAVYVNDTVNLSEELVYTKSDSTDGYLCAEYKNHKGVNAWCANYYYSKKSGLVKNYYPNGKLMSTEVYQAGKKTGEFALYNPDGKLVVKGEFDKNEKHGFWAYRNYRFMGKYHHGLKDGTWKGFDKNGNKVKLHFKKGKLQINKNKEIIMPLVPTVIFNDGLLK